MGYAMIKLAEDVISIGNTYLSYHILLYAMIELEIVITRRDT
jgi:hypothetical protein